MEEPQSLEDSEQDHFDPERLAELEAFRTWLGEAFPKNPQELLSGSLPNEIQTRSSAISEELWEERFQFLEASELIFKQETYPTRMWIRDGSRIFGKLKGQVTENYIAREVDHLGGRKLKTLIEQIEHTRFRRALSLQLKHRREQTILDAIRNRSITWDTALEREPGYGVGMDERVIEIPLAVEIADFASPGKILDAGASLNLPFLYKFIGRPEALITHYTQVADQEPALFQSDRVSYVFGDLRCMDFKDNTFDRVLCISTLEHIGMDNTRYGGAREHDKSSCMYALQEMFRVLAPGGQLLVTVPYGVRRNLKWFHVFDKKELRPLLDARGGNSLTAKYYYYENAWYEGTEYVPESLRSGAQQDEESIRGLAVLLFEKGVWERGEGKTKLAVKQAAVLGREQQNEQEDQTAEE